MKIATSQSEFTRVQKLPRSRIVILPKEIGGGRREPEYRRVRQGPRRQDSHVLPNLRVRVCALANEQDYAGAYEQANVYAHPRTRDQRQIHILVTCVEISFVARCRCRLGKPVREIVQLLGADPGLENGLG